MISVNDAKKRVCLTCDDRFTCRNIVWREGKYGVTWGHCDRDKITLLETKTRT